MKFLIQSVFPDYKSMQTMFPWLKEWPILLPYCWGLRGIRSMIFRRDSVRIVVEKYKNGDETRGKVLKQFFEKCGL